MNDENFSVSSPSGSGVSSSYFVGIRFNNANKAYFFSTEADYLKLGEAVIVETIRGIELGYVATLPLPLSQYHMSLQLKPITRVANDSDIRQSDENLVRAIEALAFCGQEISKLGLKMNLISCEYTLDRSKAIFSYLADDRVDFRELLKLLANHLHTRIELRQIGTRDKAKLIGGIGICGLPLCCSTFLNEFDGISINRAKNQLLSLNIPKLSGHCGKLICCLKYEDDVYTELRKDFPKVGLRLTYNDQSYRIASMNVLSRIVKIENGSDAQFLPLEEINKLIAKTEEKAKGEAPKVVDAMPKFEVKPKNEGTPK